MFKEIQKLFLGNAPGWYKSTIIGFLVINPPLLIVFNYLGLNGNFIIGWVFLLQFIFTLALALKCYPLQPGGLLALEAIIMGLTSTKSVFHEIENNIEVEKELDNIDNNEEDAPKLFSEDDSHKVEIAENQNEKLFDQTPLDDEEFEIPAFLRKQKF